MAVVLLLIGAVCVSVVLCAGLTKIVRDLANRLGLAAHPVSPRHIHQIPIPRIGGVALFVAFLITCGGAVLFQRSLASEILAVLMPACGLFLVGLVDDLRSLGAKVKLAMQVAGGIVLYLEGVRFACFDDASWSGSALCLAATVAWVVLVCNAINLIDGIDGLAAGAALFSMVTIFTVGLVEGHLGIALGTAILAGSVLGFLVFNFSPASIFLGDSGSLFIGFMLSGFILVEASGHVTPVRSLVIPIVALALPLSDTVLSVLRRYLSGHSLFGADREHIHHKLLELGLSQRQAVAILYSVSAIFAVLSLGLLYRSDTVLIPVIAILLLVVFFGVRRLKYQEFEEFSRVWKRTRQQKEVFARNIAVRKAAVELREVQDFARLATLLEEVLAEDFDGFELRLNPDAAVAENPAPGQIEPIRCVWKNGYEEKTALTLELSAGENRLIGQITLYRPAGSGWLVDTDLLSGDFRESLGIAVANCAADVRVGLPGMDVNQGEAAALGTDAVLQP